MATNWKNNKRRKKYNLYKGDLRLSGLDNCRLYITNIPENMTIENLEKEFSKFGKLLKFYKSNDKVKNFATVQYSTPGEARMAMAKMSNCDPYKLQIEIAQKEKYFIEENNNDNDKSNFKQEVASQLGIEELSADDFTDEFVENEEYLEDYNFDEIEDLDPDLSLEMEKLRLMEAHLLCKQRYRDFLNAKKNAISQGAEIGDDALDAILRPEEILNAKFDISLKEPIKLMPPLTETLTDSKPCVFCGSLTKRICQRCKITPYCTKNCQEKDWVTRHNGICHNLANNRLASDANVIKPQRKPY